MCNRTKLGTNETWAQQLERSYVERREHEGSDNPDTRKPRRRANWNDDEELLVDGRVEEKRLCAISKWFVRRFRITRTIQEQEMTLGGLKRWSSMNREERTQILNTIDRKKDQDDEDWRRKKGRARVQQTENPDQRPHGT